MEHDIGFKAAIEEAKAGSEEGGVPIGACLVSRDAKVLGKGHNMRVQKGSATLHAEISALEATRRLSASAYKGATMYTTLSPCDMCTGACVLYKVGRVVDLMQRGIEVTVLENKECQDLMKAFIEKEPEIWYEDIAE